MEVEHPVAGGGHESGEKHKFRIFIDNKDYEATKPRMSGSEILALAGDGDDRVLWKEERDGKERRISDDEEIELHEDERFFTTPRHINPGADQRN